MLRDGGNASSRAKPHRSVKSTGSTGEGSTKHSGIPGSERPRRSHARHQHRHGSPKSSRHYPRAVSNKHHDMEDDDSGTQGKSPPPNKAMKLSHLKSSHSSSTSESRSSMRRMDQSLTLMNNSDSSTSPESIKSPESSGDLSDQQRAGGRSHSNTDSTSGISSMSSSGCSDYSPNPSSFSDKERELSVGNDTTDPGSDGSSPQSAVNICHTSSNFKSNLSTVLEVDTNLPQAPVLQPISSAIDQQGSSGYLQTSEKFCLVCNDKATGYHFNALTCEGCKGFFRRNSQKADELKCSFNGCCKITKVTRRHCQACRLNKCFKVGMLTECIMTEEQKVVRKMKNSDKNGYNSQQDNRSSNFSSSPPFTPLGGPTHTPGVGMSHPLAGDYSNQMMGAPHAICNCSGAVGGPGIGRCANCMNGGDLYQTDVTSNGRRGSVSGGKSGQGSTGGTGFVPPNQEQLALMEELSIEYHNLYSKRATVEDVISNVPMRPRTMDMPVGRFGELDQTQIPSSNLFCADKLQIPAPNALPGLGGNTTSSNNAAPSDHLLAPVEPFLQQQQYSSESFNDFISLQTPSDVSTGAPFDSSSDMNTPNPHCDQQLLSFNSSSSFASLTDNTLDIIQVAPPVCDATAGSQTVSCSTPVGGPSGQFTFLDASEQNEDGDGAANQQQQQQQQSLPAQPGDMGEMQLSAMCRYLAAITSNRLERCVAFCQRMPGFQLLSLQDKMSLLKSGAFEILLLRSSIFMDTSLGKIRAGSFSLTPEMLMRIPYLRPFVVPFFVFISKFKSLNCDLTELLLLIGIVLFSPDRPGIHNRDAISNIQQVYADTLQAYLSTKFCQGGFDQKELCPSHNSTTLHTSRQPPATHQLHVKTEHAANATCAVASGGNMQSDDVTRMTFHPSSHHQQFGAHLTAGFSPQQQPATKPQSLAMTHHHPMVQQHPSHKMAAAAASSSPSSNSPTTPTNCTYNQQNIIHNSQKNLNSRIMKSRIRFGNLMMQICMLRSVNFEHSQSILKIDVRRKEDLGPFLREMCFGGGSDTTSPQI